MFLIRVGAKLCRTVALQDRSFPASHHDKNLRLYQIKYINVFQMFFHFHLMISWNFFDRFLIALWTLSYVVPNHVPVGPPTLHVFHVTLIKHTWFRSLIEIPWPELGVSDKGEMKKRAVLGASRNVVGNHCLMICEWRIFSVILNHCCAT